VMHNPVGNAPSDGQNGRAISRAAFPKSPAHLPNERSFLINERQR
jgi:hypothetical protein